MRSRWPAALALLCTIAHAALAGPAEISGIEKVYLRAGPGTDTAPIGVLKAGDQVNILDVQGSWTKIETQEGTVGFVYHRYIVPRLDSTPPEAAPQVIAPQSSVAAVPPGSGVAAPDDATPAPSPTEEAGAAKDELSAELASLRPV